MTVDAVAAACLWLHLAATLLMTGVIWTIQVVHYPLMAYADRERYRTFQTAHERRITVVVVPLMLTELGTAILLVVAPWSPVPRAWALAGLGLLAVIWGSTFALQVPEHRRLESGFDKRAHRRLVRTNWTRTAAWSVRAGLAIALVARFG